MILTSKARMWILLSLLTSFAAYLFPVQAITTAPPSFSPGRVYHNPDSGRFWTMDSFEGFGSDPTSLHKYTYCGNNPVNARDPSGHLTLAEVGAAMGIGAGVKVGINAIANAVYAKSYRLAYSDMYGVGDIWHDTWTGALEGAAGFGIGKAAFWTVGRVASWLLELGPVRAVVAYAKESTKLNSAYATAQEAWNALDAAVVQGSEAALRSATTALAQARAAITLLTDKVESLAALIGFDSLATHIGGAGRECTADVAGLLAKYFKIADRDGLIEGLRTWGRNNNISSTSEAINRIGNAANLTVVESTSFGVAKPGAYAVFTGQHVVFGKVLSNGEKIVVDLSGELGQRVLRNAETDFLKTAEAVMFGPR